MKREVLASISIGFISLAILNLAFNIPHINYIMVALSIYSVAMSAGQFLYQFDKYIKLDAFKKVEEKIQRFYNVGYIIGVYLINYSIFMAIIGTLLVSIFFESKTDEITISFTLVALSVLFMNIGLNED